MNAWDNEKTESSHIATEPLSAWESNKQEVPLTTTSGAAGQSTVHATGTSISDIPSSSPQALDQVSDEEQQGAEPYRKPNLGRFLLRVWQLVAAIGAFGFQVGASPYSNEPAPFGKKDLLYYGYAICWTSILWSCFNIFIYLSRRFGSGSKVKRFISTLLDLVHAALFGVCIFYEIATYSCKPGLHNGWCDFYNTGLFFLMSLFLTYVIHALWDIFGALTCIRR